MLDMSMFREHAEVLKADHDKRDMPHDNIDEVIRLDEEWRQARSVSYTHLTLPTIYSV